MPTSLQQGINAAKAGRMQEALNFLKDAIIEEPQNAEVWVWIAAIIDDLDKQEIFLDKALEIDSKNIPAQRGLAYLHKRKQDKASVQGDHLSDHTSPISPFPAGTRSKPQINPSGWSKLPKDDLELLLETSQDETINKEEKKGFFQNLPKLSPFEISLLGVVVIVFCFIGLLAASALFEFELPLANFLRNHPKLTTEPPYPGVFLYETNIFFDIQQHKGPPTQNIGIPTSFKCDPVIVLWETVAEPDQMRLIYETGAYIPFVITRGKSNSELIQPESDLENGLYCLQQLTTPPLTENALYWCFKVVSPPPEI